MNTGEKITKKHFFFYVVSVFPPNLGLGNGEVVFELMCLVALTKRPPDMISSPAYLVNASYCLIMVMN